MSFEAELSDLRSANKALEAKLDDIQTDLKVIRQAIMGDPIDHTKPGLMVRLDRLEQTEATRTKLLWILVTAIIGLIIDRIKDWL